MRRLALVEHEPRRGVRLTRAERDALRAAVPELLLTPSAGAARGTTRYDVTPGSWAGVVAVGDLVVEIAPKLPVDNVLFLVSYALDPHVWRDGARVPLEERAGLVEAVAALFSADVRRAQRHGMLHAYTMREEALPGVRGRVRVDDQVRRRFGQAMPVEVRFDDLTPDITENRLLKAALERLASVPLRSRAVASRVRHVLAGFACVGPYQAARSVAIPEVRHTRLNAHYRRALELARLILRGGSIEARLGPVPALSCLFDMDRVFEEFVSVALREALGLTEWSFPRGGAGRRLTLDDAGTLALEPDLSWWDGGRCSFVGDVKYKRSARGEHADLYQLLAYATAADLPGGLLIYAAGGAPDQSDGAHEVTHAGKTLHVSTLDLAAPPAYLLGQIDLLAQRVRRLRSSARSGAVAWPAGAAAGAY